jgi:lipoprotein-releasing system permease protein
VQGVEFVGVHPIEENQLMSVQSSMISGNFSDLRFNRMGAVLGVKLAENLKIRQGGDFYLYLKNDSIRLKVIGLLQKGTVKDETLVYISLDAAQALVGQGDVVSEIGVKLLDFRGAPALALEMNERSRYKATSWQDFNKEIARFVGNQNVTNMLFYIFILLISAFVIANTTIMVVSRRRREIGILMAMGAERRSILMIFLLENMLISVPAGVLGGMLGFALARLITFLPLDVTSAGGGEAVILIAARPEYFVYAIVFALALNLISGLYPAYTAARLDPVEAIGSE